MRKEDDGPRTTDDREEVMSGGINLIIRQFENLKMRKGKEIENYEWGRFMFYDEC
jgi:hypothetical protein